jgi:ABC-type multidrug transport system fused ATPase/permease subunit
MNTSFIKTRNKLDEVSFMKLTRWVFELIRPYSGVGIMILLAMVLETIMSLALPWPLKIIIDNVIGDRPLPTWLNWMAETTGTITKLSIAGWAALAMVFFTAIGGLAGYAISYLTENIAQHIALDLRRKIYHHLQHLSFSYYDTHQVGKLISTITTDVNTIQDFATVTLLNVIVDMLTIVGMIFVMFSLNWDFSLIVVSVVPFLFVFLLRFRRTVKKITHEVRLDQSEMMVIIQQGLESIRAVNAFGRQDLEEEKLSRIGKQIVEDSLRARRMKSMISPLITLVVAICTAFVLWRGASLVLSEFMTIGTLTVFIAYLGKFFNPVKDLAKMTGNIAQATVAAERIHHLLGSSDFIPEAKNAIEPSGIKGKITFDHVSFSYRQGIPVLKDISFEILPGQHVGICGPTGGGKSTLASLIPRFYDPDLGRIFLDDINIKNLTISGLRNQIGYVLQDTMLFYGTIRDNIAYGNLESSEEDIRNAAVRAQADDFIQQLPKGYNTMVGERGLTLSNGQRQRIGLARAILRNSPILILDEPTAALDQESEQIVTRVLKEFMKGRTVITITHRLNTILDTDVILVINDGRIIQKGSHDQLLAAGGLYARLWDQGLTTARF